MRCYLTSRWRIQKTEETGLRQLEAAVTSLDQGGDRDALLQQHDTAFCLPFRFHYHPHEGDQVASFSSFRSLGLAHSLHCMNEFQKMHGFWKRWLVTFDPLSVDPTSC